MRCLYIPHPPAMSDMKRPHQDLLPTESSTIDTVLSELVGLQARVSSLEAMLEALFDMERRYTEKDKNQITLPVS